MPYFWRNASRSASVSPRSSRHYCEAFVLACLRSAFASFAFCDTQAPKFLHCALNASRVASVVPRKSRHSCWASRLSALLGFAAAALAGAARTAIAPAQEDGPFVRDSVTDSLLATQLFIAIAAVTSLLLAAVTAERSRAERAQRALAGEQAALRRVATLVASDAEPGRVFEQVTEEVGRLLGLPGGERRAVRRRADGHRRRGVERGRAAAVPGGERLDVDGDTAVARVVRTGQAARVDRYEATSGTLAAALVSASYRAAIAAPVNVGGRLWGALAAASSSAEPLPQGIERRLLDFADLVAQALANADAYGKLARARRSSRSGTPSASGSSATSTTARSSAWCRSLWNVERVKRARIAILGVPVRILLDELEARSGGTPALDQLRATVSAALQP